MSLCYHCIIDMDLSKGSFDSYGHCPGCDTPDHLYDAHSHIYTYTFSRYVRGLFTGSVECNAIDMEDAVTQLSKQYTGVFKYNSHHIKE